jgi:hypothetical protein
VISEANEVGPNSLRTWVKVLAAQPSLILTPNSMRENRRTSTLHLLASELGWISRDVIQAASDPWLAGLANAKNDLANDDYCVLQAFFVALAIETGGIGAQRLFESFFAPIHNRLLRSYLPWKADNIPIDHLPSAGWRNSWDIGLRLRLGVAPAYVRHRLDPQSFASLSNDRRVREMLRDAAEQVDGGSSYAKAVEQEVMRP